MKKYFGTDGIRGEANRELTAERAFLLGAALGYWMNRENPRGKNALLVGRDTRISGAMLASALSAGANAQGVDVKFLGVLPTPAVAYLTKESKAGAGVVISASHNPAKDNGLKVFGPDGYKIPDETEEMIEKLMDDAKKLTENPVAGDRVGTLFRDRRGYFHYRRFLLQTVTGDFSGLKIILDTANGAAYQIAKDVFSTLSAEVVAIHDAPDGLNINRDCGSTHPEVLSRVVTGYGADLGFAFDGDADRLIVIDRRGKIVDGDKVIAVLAEALLKKGKLPGNKVVTTVMSNMGLENFLKEKGVQMLRAQVGDRYVLELMRSEGATLGGEQSGHVILSDYAVTGDGILTALKLLETLKEAGKPLDEVISGIEDWPQTLINITVSAEKKKT